MSWFPSWTTRAETTAAALEARASPSESESGDYCASDDSFDWPPLSPDNASDVDTGEASTRDVPVDLERDDDGEALLKASMWGEATKVWELAESGADVNTRQQHMLPHEGMTPLHYACQRGDIDMVETLLDAGADVDAIDSACGATALQEAALAGHVEIVEMLLKAGADVNAQYYRNSTRLPHHNIETPVYLASHRGWLAVVDTLVQAGAKVDIANRLGQCPLHVAAKKNHSRVVERLLAASADVNVVDNQGLTPLHAALQKGRGEVALLLLAARGIDVEICEPKNQQTAMHMAAEHELPQVIEALIHVKATVNVADKAGVTPLHIACWSEVPASVRLLLDAGADINAETSGGSLPIDYAFPTRKYTVYVKVPEALEIIRLLLSHGAKWGKTCDDEVKEKFPLDVGEAVRMCVELWKAEQAQGRPLTAIPVDVVESGRDATVTYIKELKTSKVVTRRRKVCLVGPSRWGKTSLIQSIKSKKPNITEEADRTIGVDAISIRAERDSLIGITHHDDITFWDFAGHDEYHAAHSVFYSRNTLYLVCIDVLAYRVQLMMVEISADTPEEKTRFLNEFMDARVLRWVLAVVAVRPDAEFEFVLTKCDTWPDGYELFVCGTQSRDEDDFESEVLHGLYTYALRIQGIVDNLKKVRHTREQSRKMDRKEEFRGSQDGPQEEAFRSTINDEDLAIVTTLADPRLPDIEYIPPIRVPAFTSCVTPEHLQLSTTLLWPLLFKHDIDFPMPEKYSRVLAEVMAMRSAVEDRASNAMRIQQSMVDVKGLVQTLCEQVADLDKATCRVILRTLCDLGDVLWFEDLGNDKLRDMVFLDPRLTMDFIRQIINHKQAHETISHAAIKGLPLWGSLDRETMCAMKRLLQHFQLVHPTAAGEMAWDSDLLVPAFRRTQSYAVFLFLGQDLTLRPGVPEARHVHWEYHFENWLPGTLFDHVAVASYHPRRERRAGPDWILYGDPMSTSAAQ